MNKMLSILLLGASAPLAVAASDTASSAAFRTEVRIEVDENGHVADVVPDRELPPVLDKAVRAHVSAWRFDAPLRHGRRVSGTTYAFVSGCAVPAPDGIALSFAPARNGPGHGMQGVVGTHLLPLRELGEGSFTFNVEYRVQPDGSVVVDAVKNEGRRSNAIYKFEKSIAKWLATRRFLPEQVDGEPVATRMALPITYEIRHAQPGARMPRGEAVDTACQVAAEGAASTPQQPVAVDSPFRMQPAG